MPLSLPERFAAAMRALPAAEADLAGGLGVAVSGGGDSTALLLLARDWTRAQGVPLAAASVDHGLRGAQSRGEAEQVARLCADLGIGHEILTWRGWDGQGNLQAAARKARQALLGAWARERGIGAVLLGHTQDDQAETLLMRLARGSGLDGLAAMAPARRAGGLLWLRPLLGLRRDELRAFLREAGIGWSEDPSNRDRRFARVRMREALSLLGPLGIDAKGLAATAARLQEARAALEAAAQRAARRIAHLSHGAVIFERAGFLALPPELRRRLLAHALRWVSGADHGPRHEKLMAALERIAAGDGGRLTLHGCLLECARGRIAAMREPAAVAALKAAPDALWDGRWRLSGPPAPAGAHLGALGPAGLARLEGWRGWPLSRPQLLAAPALWHEGAVLAVLGGEMPGGWRFERVPAENDFFTSLLSH